MTSLAIVTGGAKGIGRAISEVLLTRGYDVVMTGRDHEALLQSQELLTRAHPGTRAAGLTMDVRRSEAVESAFEAAVEFGGTPSLLVNCAGVIARGPAVEVPEAEWQNVVDTDLTGAFRCCQAFLRRIGTTSGAIVNVASIASYVGISGRVAYTSSKAGLMGLTRTLALEWARHGVRINTVAPGWTATEMVMKGIADGKLDEEKLCGRIPMGRLAAPSEIAAVVAFLASDDASYITGQTIIVDGGIVINGDA